MEDVAIIGVGLHPFGRFGDKPALEMGAEAVRAACADAAVPWKDVQFAFGGSAELDTPDVVVNRLGLTGIPFMGVYNGCATAATALQLTADIIRSGQHEIGVAVGMDKHLPGALTADPVNYGAPSWYGDLGYFLTTKFFGMKINRYMHDHGISHETLAKVAAKNFRNGGLNPNAFRRKPIPEEDILASRMLNYPLTQYMFCAPDEGAAAVVLCRADLAHRYTSTPIYLRATALRSRRYGAHEVHSTWAAIEQDDAPTVYASRAAYEMAGIGPEDVDVIQLQDTDAGAEVIHMAENGFCADGEQEKLIADGATEIDGPLPVNTDGGLIANGEPVGASGLRQVHELVHQLRGQAGDRQVPGSPKVGYAQLYGAPGTAGVSILST
ncbi:MAG: thiolase family protein [Acidimicrobiales bacterium]|jgi:acetyl-CoA acetyltransferase